MKILWLAWKDMAHPKRGGAEVVLRELTGRQVTDGHQVTLLTAGYDGAATQEILPNGVEVIRVGNNRYTHSIQALVYYLRHLRGKFDLIIETVNTAPYFSLLFRGKAKGLALYHQLARDIWFFEAKSPVSQLGYYIIEPLSTWLLGRAKAPLVTVSESTKQDLARFGWDPSRTHIISQGIGTKPLTSLRQAPKFRRPTIVSFGTMRGMKRTLDQIKAFEIAKRQLPALQLKLAGDASDPYGQQVLSYAKNSPFADDITYLGRPDDRTKQELMRKSHLITVTSIKEGWGLIVTEAASQGTPAVVYDVDGLRDSVLHQRTGLVTTPSPEALAVGIVDILSDPKLYQAIQRQGWQWSKQMTFEKSYSDFKQVIQESIA